MGAGDPTHGQAVDTATAGEDGASAKRNENPRDAVASIATVTIRDLRTVEHKRNEVA
jgi:hypothetical protein